jgi:hypothetical protein
LKEAVAILAQWEYRNPANPNEGKKIVGDLLSGTMQYINDTPKRKIPKNNFELLKDNNKILFGKTGLLSGIAVRGEDDPNVSQKDLAEQILAQFNTQPNNFGFAIVSPDGSVKLYAIQIDKLPGVIAQPENTSHYSLGGVIVGKALIFNSLTDSLTFTSGTREYTVTLSGNEINLSYELTEQKPTKTIPIKYSEVLLEEGIFEEAKKLISADSSIKNSIKSSINSLSIQELNNVRPHIKIKYAEALEPILTTYPNSSITKLYEFLKNGSSTTLNVQPGDLVTKTENDFDNPILVIEVNGNLIHLDNAEIIDITKDSLFKLEDFNYISCSKIITMTYGK